MKRLAVILAGAVLAAGPAAAHHSTAQYDSARAVEATGTVKAFTPSNPHMQLTIEVSDAGGRRTLELEGQGVNNMYRVGYKRGIIKVGDKVTVRYAPLRAGMEGYDGLFQLITLADGTKIGRAPAPAADPR